MKPSSGAIPYLHVRQTEGSLLPSGLSITGNTKALVQLRKQIDRALEDAEGYPLDDATYRELGGDEYEVLVTRARSREEMEKPRTSEEASESSEQLPWAQSARRTREQSE